MTRGIVAFDLELLSSNNDVILQRVDQILCSPLFFLLLRADPHSGDLAVGTTSSEPARRFGTSIDIISYNDIFVKWFAKNKYKIMFKKLFFLLVLAIFLPMAGAKAHNPRLVETDPVKVENPEISQAFYDELPGDPRTYQMSSAQPFELYLNLIVPDSSNPAGRYAARIYAVAPNGNRQLIYDLLSTEKEWEFFAEPFAGDDYWQGPTWQENLPPGDYEVLVYNEKNQGKYVLAVGREEYFPWYELVNSINVIPDLKKDFFELSRADFLFSVFGGVYVFLALIIGFLVGLISYLLYKIFRKDKRRKVCNMNLMDRFLRLFGALILFLVGIFWSWHPAFFILAGFMLFAFLSKFCVLFLLIKRNSCK